MGIGASAIRAGRAFVEICADDSKLQQGLKRAQLKLKAFGNAARSVGMNLVAAGTAIAVPFALAMRTFASFEQQMARVKALTGASEADFNRLSQAAQQLGKSTVFSASQAAEAMSAFALAGFDVDKILTAIGPTLDLAAAGQLEIGQAADIATKIMAGMGLEADELGEAVDVLAKAMTTANTDLGQLGDAMKFVGPIAKSAGLAFEEVVAAIQLLSNAGIQGEMAGTTLRGAILALTSPSSEAASVMSELGIHVNDAQGNMRPLVDILLEMNKAMDSLGSGEKLDLLGRIFPARTAGGMAELLAQGSDRLVEFTENLRNSGGTAKRIADTQLNTLQGAWKLIMSAVEGVAIAIGDALLPMVSSLAATVIKVVNAFGTFVKENQRVIKVVAAVGVACLATGAPLVALGATVTAVSATLGMMHTTLGMVRTAMLATAAATKALWVAMIANPAVAALAAVAVVIGVIAIAVGTTAKKTAELTDEMTRLREEGDRQRSTDLARMERLKQLANKTGLTNAETREAIRLKRELEQRYGALGIEIDEETKKIENAATAFERLADAMVKVATQQLDAEIAETQKNIRKLTDEIQKAGAVQFKLRSGWYVDWETFNRDLAQRDQLFKQLATMQGRKEDMLGGNKSAIASNDGSFNKQTEADARVQASQYDEEWSRRIYRLRLEQIEDETQRAIAMIDEKYDHEIKKAREAGAYPETIAQIEEARALEIDNLQRDLAKRRAKENEQLEHQLELIRLRGIEDEHEREIATIDAQYEYERKLAEEAGDAKRVQLLDQMQAAEIELANAREAARVRQDAMEVANANKSREETIEELRLRATKKGYDLELALLQLQRRKAIAAAKAAGENVALVEEEFDLREKLLQRQEGVEGAMDQMSTSVKGTFSAAALAGMGYNGIEERTAKAAEETAKHTRQLVTEAQNNRMAFA